MRNTSALRALAVAALLITAIGLRAQVPGLTSYQGRVAVAGVNFSGTGSFKFALVDTTGATTYWSNDGTSVAGSEPTAAISLTVTSGLFSVLLGDVTTTNMEAVPLTVWANADVRMRVWFNDGVNGFQLLTPDQRLAPNGYLADGCITSAKLAPSSVGSSQLASGLVLNGSLTGNATTATSAGSFTGSLVGDVTGTQSATVVSFVDGVTAANVAAGANQANAATNLDTVGSLVKRDGSGDFSAGTITATAFSGSGSALTNLTASNMALTGFSPQAGTVTATDSILTAVDKLVGNDALYAPLASPTFSGNVGIGATSLTSTLVVAGVIESTSGGVKFPDGTTQTTAAAGTATGAAEFVRTIQSPNNSVPPGTAFTIDTQVVNSIPTAIVASAGAGGTVFTLSPGTYVLDYEMSLGSAGSVGLYTGPTAGALVLDSNTIAGAATATTWIHGRALKVVAGSPLVVAVSSVVGTAFVVTAGTAAGTYMIRLTVLKIQ